MKALSQLNYLPENKEQIESFYIAAKNEILSGELDVLDIVKKIKIIEKTFEKILKDIDVKDTIFQELHLHNDKYESSECDISHTNRTKYDYSNDETWLRLNSDKKSIDSKIKDREKYLKSLNTDNQGFDGDTGEVVQAPIKTYIDVLTIKIK